jgi:hypothetical protein
VAYRGIKEDTWMTSVPVAVKVLVCLFVMLIGLLIYFGYGRRRSRVGRRRRAVRPRQDVSGVAPRPR